MFHAYLLTRPRLPDGLYTTLLVDTDCCQRMNSLVMYTHAELIEMLQNSLEYHFENAFLASSNIMLTSGRLLCVDDIGPSKKIDLHTKITLCSLFRILVHFNASLLVGDSWIDCSKLSFSLSSDCISYTDINRNTSVIWTTPCTDEMQPSFIQVIVPSEIELWLYSELGDACTINQHILNINLSMLQIVPSVEQCVLRYHAAELVYLASQYQLHRAFVHGIECGSWYMHHLAGDDREMFTHYKPRISKLVSPLKVSFDVDFPDAVTCQRLLLQNTDTFTKLVHAQSNSDFYDCLFPYTGCKHINKNFISFADGFMAQLSDQKVLKDHELLELDKLQTTISEFAIQLYEYRQVLKVAPIDIGESLMLPSGVLRISREV